MNMGNLCLNSSRHAISVFRFFLLFTIISLDIYENETNNVGNLLEKELAVSVQCIRIR